MTAAEMKALLKLEPHPIEGGHFRQTYVSAEKVQLERGMRSAGTAIYYLLEEGAFSEMHMLRSDEIFHFYLVTRWRCYSFIRMAARRFFCWGRTWRQGSMCSFWFRRGFGRDRGWWRAEIRRCWGARFRRDSIMRIIKGVALRSWRRDGRHAGSTSACLPDDRV
jgi:hypothetical protein